MAGGKPSELAGQYTAYLGKNYSVLWGREYCICTEQAKYLKEKRLKAKSFCKYRNGFCKDYMTDV